MKKLVLITLAAAALAACSPVTAVTSTAIGAGQIALGAADVIL
ncbi:lipoprotein [Yoonia sp. 208BN28-4]